MSDHDRELSEPERADLARLVWLSRLVRDMRRHQLAYFKYKQASDLRASKDLERRVDEAVTLILDPRQAMLPMGDPLPSLPRNPVPVPFPPEPLDPRD